MTDQNGTLTARQVSYLQRWKQAKDRLLGAIDGLDESTMATEEIVDGWTVKDLLVHIISWNDEFRANIDMILGGQQPGYDHQISGANDYHNWNQRRVEEKRGWSLDRVLADIERDHREAIDLIKSLRPQDFRKRGITPWKANPENPDQPVTEENSDSVDTLVTYHWRHMHEHILQIEDWRKKRKKP